MTDLVLVTLAVFFIWESAYAAIPWSVPAWLQPLLVYGVAAAFVWPDWRLALSACGAVAVLHVLVQVSAPRITTTPSQVVSRRSPRAGVPELP